jgi:hypothetical protein
MALERQHIGGGDAASAVAAQGRWQCGNRGGSVVAAARQQGGSDSVAAALA